MKKKKKEYKLSLSEHNKVSNENLQYAIKRLDVLIILLSSGGIYLVIDILKIPDNESFLVSHFYILTSAGIFSFAIITNIISQWTGYKANEFEQKWIQLEMDICEKKG
jgi:hypothetical protein